ncbi:Ubiquitin-specific protease [Klebsormidium nitens]|uniref:Ubiquitin carboxyl-terminal hydrolase n=1 Tax=Klebsormidium nitens TaxID=105231 RepID=A0A1Y1I0W6_KLENI|nr:Ubiquitin-specific protease [Klebsormidium nitens]|eukprot:GAQ83602.1 Ubiquitin-specific protease [Klebsormidium nitens]
MVKVSVKWQKEEFALEVDETQPPVVFKTQLFSLTGVPPERQKIMVKGGLLKDDGDWNKVGLKAGQKLMMMGTADKLPEAPKDAPVFVEDLPEDQQEAALTKDASVGLINLGNTCYMNSTIQCLHSVPELKDALSLYKPQDGIGADNNHKLTLAAKALFKELDTSYKPVMPFNFLMLFRQLYPQFAQTGEGGAYMQQDAEECWSQFIYALSTRLRDTQGGGSSAVVNDLFGIDMTSTLRSEESGEESTEAETVYKLGVHISSEVNYVHEGIKHGLKGELEKNSSVLGRSAVFQKTSRISKLPQYLTVQFVRFFWKKDTQKKAKILRPVHYPMNLDVFDFCTEELQEKLKPARKKLREQEDLKAGLEKKNKGKGIEGATSATDAKEEKVAGDTEMSEAHEVATADAPKETSTADSKGAGPSSSSSEAAGSSKELTGIYDLWAVLTHKGRSADSGHYTAWVKQDKGGWTLFDDDKPIPQREDDILKLAGGGDWHMAYICLYKARVPSA